MTTPHGTAGTREYYQDRGWAEEDGEIVEATLFGTKEDGPLRRGAFEASMARVRAALARAGTPLRLLELGCGGHPETRILDLCRHYVGIDFSTPGLHVAARTLADQDVAGEPASSVAGEPASSVAGEPASSVAGEPASLVAGEPASLVAGDICSLPVPDGRFDAVYSAHVLYHIADEPSQRAAFEEVVRVLRPGGVAVLIVANPRPLLFPGRTAKRLIADAPVLGELADRLRPPPPIPFRPLTIGTMRGFLEPHGDVEVVTAGIPTVSFNQRVTEYRGLGRRLWQGIHWLETRHPEAATRLGNYIQLTFTKRP